MLLRRGWGGAALGGRANALVEPEAVLGVVRVRRWTAGQEGDATHHDRVPSTSRQKASTRAFHSSGTSWKGWWDSSPHLEASAWDQLGDLTAELGATGQSRPPASTSVGAAICRQAVASCRASMNASRERCRSSVACLCGKASASSMIWSTVPSLCARAV